jgi:hypothetical protein
VGPVVATSEEKREDIPLPAFDKMPFEALEVLCAFWDGESEAAPFSIHAMMQAGQVRGGGGRFTPIPT